MSHYSAPGGMRAGFEYYRAFPEDIKQNEEYSNVKLPMPILALGGQCSFGNAALESMRMVATDVRGGIVPDSGHWIPEERPAFLVNHSLNSLETLQIIANKIKSQGKHIVYAKVFG